jgi:hypothetical protein
MASYSGWIAALFILVAAWLPLWPRLRTGKRAAPDAKPIRAHVALGLATLAAAFLHTVIVLPDLGSPAAVGGGSVAFALGALAFVVLVVHAGFGLRLRDPKLRRRAESRKRHAVTAMALALAVLAHAIVLLRAG